jgi:transporter family protein
MWILYALLGAVFAALTSILAKIGIKNVDSNLATAIRTVVVLLMAWGIVFATGKAKGIVGISQKSWIFLGLSGVATGLSWLFFYKALQLGDASKVIPIDKFSLVLSMILAFVVLHEKLDLKTVIGGAIITLGTFILIL